MEIKGNIIYMPNADEKCVIKTLRKTFEFEKNETLEEMKKKIVCKLHDVGLGKFKDEVSEFVENCNLYGSNSTKMRIIPEYRVAEGKIKVYVLMWNGTMENAQFHGLPLKIKGESTVLENIMFTDLPNIKPNQFVLFEGVKENENGLVEDIQNKVSL